MWSSTWQKCAFKFNFVKKNTKNHSDLSWIELDEKKTINEQNLGKGKKEHEKGGKYRSWYQMDMPCLHSIIVMTGTSIIILQRVDASKMVMNGLGASSYFQKAHLIKYTQIDMIFMTWSRTGATGCEWSLNLLHALFKHGLGFSLLSARKRLEPA